MPKINLKIIAPCLNYDNKDKIFNDLEKRGAKIEDHQINFKLHTIKVWVTVYKENFDLFENSLLKENQQFTIMSASRGKDRKDI